MSDDYIQIPLEEGKKKNTKDVTYFRMAVERKPIFLELKFLF